MNAESDELSREAAHCLTFIGQKDSEFIQKEILPILDEKVLIKEKYVLLLSQFIVLDGFIGRIFNHPTICMDSCVKSFVRL